MMLHPEWVHYVRGRDARIFMGLLSSRVRRDRSHEILEIGGGDGYIAHVLAGAGFNVICTDPKPRLPLCHHVQIADASSLPFADGRFDAVISSNVLEHIRELPGSLSEMKRVLRPGGVMIHSMPRPACSFLTTLTAPLAYLRGWRFLVTGRFLDGKDLTRPLPQWIPFSASINRRPILRRRTLVVLHAVHLIQPLRILRIACGHGVAHGPVDELIRWRAARWRTLFRNSELDVLEYGHSDLCTSMNKLFPHRFIRLREAAARHGLAYVSFYVVAPTATDAGRQEKLGMGCQAEIVETTIV